MKTLIGLLLLVSLFYQPVAFALDLEKVQFSQELPQEPSDSNEPAEESDESEFEMDSDNELIRPEGITVKGFISSDFSNIFKSSYKAPFLKKDRRPPRA